MRIIIRNALLLLTFLLSAQLATADVSGDWTLAVVLGDAGSGNAEITLSQEAEGKMSGNYSGQLQMDQLREPMRVTISNLHSPVTH